MTRQSEPIRPASCHERDYSTTNVFWRGRERMRLELYTPAVSPRLLASALRRTSRERVILSWLRNGRELQTRIRPLATARRPSPNKHKLPQRDLSGDRAMRDTQDSIVDARK